VWVRAHSDYEHKALTREFTADFALVLFVLSLRTLAFLKCNELRLLRWHNAHARKETLFVQKFPLCYKNISLAPFRAWTFLRRIDFFRSWHVFVFFENACHERFVSPLCHLDCIVFSLYSLILALRLRAQSLDLADFALVLFLLPFPRIFSWL
jgi:multisubunit Na+/H+ antiporter MnhF subunit